MNFGKVSRLLRTEDDDERSYTGSNESFLFDSDEDSEYSPVTSKGLQTYERGIKQIARKPTRVPNLKIQNRNALLARENRKRKKEILESLEKNTMNLQVENRSLHKILKFKDSQIDKLTREVKYLKSVISNRTEIVSILKSLPPIYASTHKKKTIDSENDYSAKSSDTLSCTPSFDNGNESKDPFMSTTTIDDFPSTDLDVVSTDWDEILKNPFSSESDFSEMLESGQSPSVISTEHNYFEKGNLAEQLPGVCLHINDGKVSLEFCAICHYNSSA